VGTWHPLLFPWKSASPYPIPLSAISKVTTCIAAQMARIIATIAATLAGSVGVYSGLVSPQLFRAPFWLMQYMQDYV
jgi:formate-dependent nitrite reductase membrane component NrfD